MMTPIRKLLATVIAVMPGIALAQQTPATSPSKLTLYKTADSAACSGDVTVWVDPDTLAYYVKGEKFFGKTKRGGYSCRKQADAAGYHSSKAH
jgi:hypothetical protein